MKYFYKKSYEIRCRKIVQKVDALMKICIKENSVRYYALKDT